MTQSTPLSRVSLRGTEAGAISSLETVGSDDAEAIVAVGADALTSAALGDTSLPLLAAGVGDGRYGTTSETLDVAVEALATGNYRTVTHPILGVQVAGDEIGRAVFDVTLMTSEPARISEYALTVGDECLFELRADGVVVSAPLGSAEYGRAAGGPVIAPGGGLSVVPVAAFSTRASPWVVPGGLTLYVERDEGAVSLFTDEDERQQVKPGEPVSVRVVDEFSCLRPQYK